MFLPLYGGARGGPCRNAKRCDAQDAYTNLSMKTGKGTIALTGKLPPSDYMSVIPASLHSCLISFGQMLACVSPI